MNSAAELKRGTRAIVLILSARPVNVASLNFPNEVKCREAFSSGLFSRRPHAEQKEANDAADVGAGWVYTWKILSWKIRSACNNYFRFNFYSRLVRQLLLARECKRIVIYKWRGVMYGADWPRKSFDSEGKAARGSSATSNKALCVM